jgi:hypothetical protein
MLIFVPSFLFVSLSLLSCYIDALFFLSTPFHLFVSLISLIPARKSACLYDDIQRRPRCN